MGHFVCFGHVVVVKKRVSGDTHGQAIGTRTEK